MIRQIGFLLIASSILLLSSCSYESKFELKGTVQDGATGEPIPNVKVEIQDADHHKLADGVFSDERGEFQLTFGTIPGSKERKGWRVVLEANKFEVTAVK